MVGSKNGDKLPTTHFFARVRIEYTYLHIAYIRKEGTYCLTQRLGNLREANNYLLGWHFFKLVQWPPPYQVVLSPPLKVTVT